LSAPGDGASIPRVILRGLRGRCPACGRGRLFDGFFTARERCDSCSLELRDPKGDTWAILYLATGAITGMFIILMLLLPPKNMQLGRAVLIPLVAVAFGATIPLRRGFAIAVNFVIKQTFGE
jgi:uncharacterized protein (DUF983 family)